MLTVTGYPRTTKLLHWATVLVLLAQFSVGYLLDLDEGADRAEQRLERRADAAPSEAEEERLEQRADLLHDRRGDHPGALLDRALAGDEPLLTLHVGLGLTLLSLAVVRLVRRRVVPLPPWAEGLSEGERRLAHRTEQVLYVALAVMPLSGLGVLLVDGDVLPVHVASHVVFFAAVTAHVGLVLKHQLPGRDGLLRRML